MKFIKTQEKKNNLLQQLVCNKDNHAAIAPSQCALEASDEDDDINLDNDNESEGAKIKTARFANLFASDARARTFTPQEDVSTLL